MSKIRNTAILHHIGYDLLAIALKDIIPAHHAITAAGHRSRKHPSELYPQWRNKLCSEVRSHIEGDRRFDGRQHPYCAHLVDLFGIDATILEYILKTIMPQLAQCTPTGPFEADRYEQWAHDLKALVNTAVAKDREYYGGTQTSAK